MTIPQYVEKRFKSPLAGTLASVVILLFMVPYMVGVIKGGALALGSLLGLSYTKLATGSFNPFIYFQF